jgi:hypothetical protein
MRRSLQSQALHILWLSYTNPNLNLFPSLLRALLLYLLQLGLGKVVDDLELRASLGLDLLEGGARHELDERQAAVFPVDVKDSLETSQRSPWFLHFHLRAQ